MQKVDSEEDLVFALKMVRSEIKNEKFNISRRRVLMNYLVTVDFKAITMKETTWAYLIDILKFIANQSDVEESEKALSIFAEIITLRAYDTSTVIAYL